MTSLAIILGMVPTAVAVGASGSFRAPMAIAVIGGTISSTLLSLVAVPVIYTLIDDVMVAFSRLFRRKSAVEITPGSATLTDTEEEPESKMRAISKNHTKQRKWWRR
jgi:hypothetical protein